MSREKQILRFTLDLSEAELLDVKNVFARHFADRLTKRVETIWQEKGYATEDMER